MMQNTTPTAKALRPEVGEHVDYSQADKNCRKCHGTGRTGFVVEPIKLGATPLPPGMELAGRRIPIPCRCLSRASKEILTEKGVMRKLPTVTG